MADAHVPQPFLLYLHETIALGSGSSDQFTQAFTDVYQPSFGPLRASLGADTAALEARVSVFAMIETAVALADVDAICAVPGLAGIYVGPADLAISMGVGASLAITDPDVRAASNGINRAASAAGLVPAIHAGNGKVGYAMAQMGFRMITLAAESQALRRGAAAGLEEARGER